MDDTAEYKGQKRNGKGKEEEELFTDPYSLRGWKLCAWQEINGGELSLVASGLAPEMLVFPR